MPWQIINEAMKENSVTISSREARHGCRKNVRINEINKDIMVMIPAGIKNGSCMFVSADSRDINGRLIIDRYPVTVYVNSTGFLIRLLLCIICISPLISQLCEKIGEGIFRTGDEGSVYLYDNYYDNAFNAENSRAEIKANTEDTASWLEELRDRVTRGLPDTTASADFDADEIRLSIPGYSSKYLINQLDKEMNADFCAMYQAVMDFKDDVLLPYPVNNNEIGVLMYLLRYECPELIQLSKNAVTYSSGLAAVDQVYKTTLSYDMTEEEYSAHKADCMDIIMQIKADTAGMADADKELYVYNYLAERITYDKSSLYCDNAYGALVNGKVKCDGISQAMKWLCDEIGIPCIILAGAEAGDPIGHAWNVVNVNGIWSDVDLTADVRIGNNRDYIMYPAYNVSDAWIRSKYPLYDAYDGLDIPENASMDMSYHAMSGEFLRAGSDLRQYYTERLTEAYYNGENIIRMQFENADDMEKFISSINDYDYEWVNAMKVGLHAESVSSPDYNTILLNVGFD